MAYHSDVSGTFEVYVERYPSLGDRQKLSTGGDRWATLSPDGQRLYYRTFDGRQVFEARVSNSDGGVSIGAPRRVFDRADVPDPRFPSYDVMPDGKGLVVVKQVRNSAERMNIVVVQDWFAELRQRVPVE